MSIISYSACYKVWFFLKWLSIFPIQYLELERYPIELRNFKIKYTLDVHYMLIFLFDILMQVRCS